MLNNINLTFSPIYINAFRKYCSNYASNCIVKGFEINIDLLKKILSDENTKETLIENIENILDVIISNLFAEI